MSLGGIISGSMPIKCSVPQGSILDPLLFLLYINDIASSSKLLQFIIFADDTNIFFSHSDLDPLINTVNTELCKIVLWLEVTVFHLTLIRRVICCFVESANVPLILLIYL